MPLIVGMKFGSTPTLAACIVTSLFCTCICLHIGAPVSNIRRYSRFLSHAQLFRFDSEMA